MVSWFTDYPGWPHIYSIHHLVHCGMSKYDKTAGQWVGPSTAAYLLRYIYMCVYIYRRK